MADPQRPARGRKPAASADPVEPTAAPVPDTVSAPPSPSPAPIGLGAPPPRDLRDIDFFAYLAGLTAGEWDDRVVYLYRQDRNIGKADPSAGKYIAKFVHAFDEETVSERFGGGRFLAIVKNQRTNEAERKHSFEIEGHPKLQADEVQKVPPGAAGGGSLEQLVGSLTDRLVSVVQESKKNPGGDEDAVARVAQTMQRGMEGIVTMMQSAMVARDQSTTGNPLADKLIETALLRMQPAAAPAEAGDSLRSTLALLRELGVVGGGGGGRGSLREMLGELRDVFGVEPAALLGGGVGGGMDWKAALGTIVPQVVQVGHELLQTWRMNSERQFQIAVMNAQARGPAGAPAAAPPAAPPPPAPAEPPTSALPSQFAAPPPAMPATGRGADGAPDFDWVRQFVVRQFRGGRSGEFCASMLQELFPDQVAFFSQAFGNAQDLFEFSKLDAILSAVAGEQEFGEFVREFAETMQPEPAAVG